MNEQTLKLLEDPEGFVRLIAERVIAEQPKEPVQLEEYVSIKTAARMFDIPENTLRAWLKQGRLKRHKIGGCVRVKVSELLALK
jgi:excisionase family DNA binding protein